LILLIQLIILTVLNICTLLILFLEMIMEKKKIQEQRMKGYFIQATKEILKGEGLKCLSVRNIADKAGYSYATMYNYFKDVKELIFECVKDFQDECEEIVRNETKKSPRGKNKIKAIIKSYMKFFVQYPGIFELFFLEKISDIGSKQPTIELIRTFLDRLCSDEWNYCISQEAVTTEEAELVKIEINYVVTGMLLFYNNRIYPNSYKKFRDLTDIQINRIFNNI
jgi:AcrR family transcriptional regulator